MFVLLSNLPADFFQLTCAGITKSSLFLVMRVDLAFFICFCSTASGPNLNRLRISNEVYIRKALLHEIH